MSACTTQQASPSVDLPVISVNGQQIDNEVFANEIQYHAALSLEDAVQKAGQALVIRQLLTQQLSADKKEVEGTGNEEAFDQLVNANAVYQPVSHEDCQRYYLQNTEKFRTAPILQVSHILLAAAANDPAGRVEKKQLAEDLIRRLGKQPDLFAEFAAEFSDCPSKQTEGSLGQISHGQTVAEFERQLFVLPEGMHQQAIESRYGYHIVFIHKKIPGKQLEFNMVEQQIKQYLDHRRYRQAIGDYLYSLARDADIEGIELKLDQENIIVS